MAVVTLLTDFGERDYYVAAVKGVLARLAPAATVIDLSHEIAPGDVAAAGFFLRAAAPEFPPDAIHLAVVDPGVGSDRRILAARGESGVFVAPDNGLLTGLLEGAEARSITRAELFLERPGSTFHGRDRFAPAAAFLAAGGEFERLGPIVGDPVRLVRPAPRRRRQVLEGRVVHIDRFGNLVTDIPTEWLGEAAFVARVADHETRGARVASHYAELPEGGAALLPGSLGTLELAARGTSLAARWRVRSGARVSIRKEAGCAPPEDSR